MTEVKPKGCADCPHMVRRFHAITCARLGEAVVSETREPSATRPDGCPLGPDPSTMPIGWRIRDTRITREQAEAMAPAIAQSLTTPQWRCGGWSTATADGVSFEVSTELVRSSAVADDDAVGLRATLVEALTGCDANDAMATCERVIADCLAEVAK